MISTKTAVLAPNRDLALVPPEYGVVVLTTRPRRSVWRSIVWYVGGRKPDVPGYCSINFMRTKWTVHVSVQFVWRSCRSVTVCRWYCVMFHHIVPRSALHVIKLQENAGLSVLLKTWISSSCFTLQRSQYWKFDFASSCISPSAWNNLEPTGRIFRKFHIEGFSKICRESVIFIKIWHK